MDSLGRLPWPTMRVTLVAARLVASTLPAPDGRSIGSPDRITGLFPSAKESACTA